ncbi:hypothetical protein PENTCL1PPCAC_21909, partial [Pristionchus entomophagus]
MLTSMTCNRFRHLIMAVESTPDKFPFELFILGRKRNRLSHHSEGTHWNDEKDDDVHHCDYHLPCHRDVWAEFGMDREIVQYLDVPEDVAAAENDPAVLIIERETTDSESNEVGQESEYCKDIPISTEEYVELVFQRRLVANEKLPHVLRSIDG